MESRNSANYLRNINAGKNDFFTIFVTDTGSVSHNKSEIFQNFVWNRDYSLIY